MERFLAKVDISVLGIGGLDILLLSMIAILTTVLMIFVGYKLLQMLQLTGYKIKGFSMWLKETKWSYISRLFMLSFLSIASMLITNVLLDDFFVIRVMDYSGVLFFFLFSSLFITNLFTSKQKTPLKYTKRMTRFVACYVVITLIVSVVIEVIGFLFIPYLSYALIGIIPLLLLPIVFASYYIMLPLEKFISKTFIKKAKKRLKNVNGIKIVGITGSYGKTTVKNILGTILSEKYRVCISPSSYNTPLGLSKTILNNLNDDDQVFIAEMGAKQRYDIKELCEMVEPTYGVITGIGNQHLLTFGSEENIIKTKGELAEYITAKGGNLYINIDSKNAKELAKTYKNAQKIAFCAEKSEDKQIYISAVKTTKTGSEFDLCQGKQKVHAKTVLLGEHNISNILLAANVAFDFGLSLEEISSGIGKLVPISHRLEIIKSASTYTIIDDAYNSSVEGSKASLNVLSKFEGKKFVITPGLVELGSEQFNANFEFGRNLAAVCDYVIIDSSINYDAISSGLIFAGFNDSNILLTTNLNNAVKLLGKYIKANDVVLFENDLPDNYN